MCNLYNQRDETNAVFYIIIRSLHVSIRFFRPSSGAFKTICSLGYIHVFLLSIAGVDVLELQR
jgi:hypothetical protein